MERLVLDLPDDSGVQIKSEIVPDDQIKNEVVIKEEPFEEESKEFIVVDTGFTCKWEEEPCQKNSSSKDEELNHDCGITWRNGGQTHSIEGHPSSDKGVVKVEVEDQKPDDLMDQRVFPYPEAPLTTSSSLDTRPVAETSAKAAKNLGNHDASLALQQRRSQSREFPHAAVMEPTTSSAPTQTRTCILHVEEEKPPEKRACQDVHVFNQKTWATVLKAAQNRRTKRNFEQSKYFGVVMKLPDQPGEHDGFHLKCHQNFTAVKAATGVEKTRATPNTKLQSIGMRQGNSSSVGIFPEECLFCGLKRRKKKDVVEVLGSCETLEAANNIHEAAKKLGDDELLGKICGVDLIAKEAKYHHSCKSAYLLKASRLSTSQESSSTAAEKGSGAAIKDLHAYVERYILVEKRAELLTSVYERYLDFCLSEDEIPMQRSSLMRNLTTVFGARIKVHAPVGKKLGNILYNAETAEDAVRIAYDYSNSDERIITKAALLLRKQMLKAPKKELPLNPTLSDVWTGDVSPPELVTNFFRILYSGGSNPCGKRNERRVQSTSQDALLLFDSLRKGLIPMNDNSEA